MGFPSDMDLSSLSSTGCRHAAGNTIDVSWLSAIYAVLLMNVDWNAKLSPLNAAGRADRAQGKPPATTITVTVTPHPRTSRSSIERVNLPGMPMRKLTSFHRLAPADMPLLPQQLQLAHFPGICGGVQQLCNHFPAIARLATELWEAGAAQNLCEMPHVKKGGRSKVATEAAETAPPYLQYYGYIPNYKRKFSTLAQSNHACC
jgi:hypothetical protein